MALGEIYKLDLECVVAGGDALGRFNGKPVFVKRGAPDETVFCRVVEEHNRWARAELLEIVKPSAARVDGVCAFHGKCGGCNLQHIGYDAQLSIKISILKETFSRIGGFHAPGIEIFPSPPWEYRNRTQFHCFRQRSKSAEDPKYGLMGENGEIIAITDCPVASPPIREILRRGGAGLLPPPEKDRFTVFSKDDVLLSEGGRERGKIKILDREILLDAGVFFQSNCVMLEKLISELIKTAESADRRSPMADLYCGVGTFAVFLSGLFPKTLLAEENKKAVSLARENLKGTDAEFFALRDAEWQRALERSKISSGWSAFSFVVADPPRSGLSSKLAASLAREGPAVIAYVSCDAASLARDSKILMSGGYKLNKLALFDFYPQTAHIESLAVFKKEKYQLS